MDSQRKINQHGQRNFDKQYFGAYYKKYTHIELIKVYRWQKGWFRLMKQIYPLEDGRGKKALEIGCGLGGFSRMLSESGYDVDASDISSFIIEKAKKLQKNIKFTTENIEKKSEIRDKYNLIVALEVLEHLNKPEAAMLNLINRLKNRGVLIFSSPYPTKRTLSNPSHINVRSPQEWVKLGKKLGFKEMKFQYVSFLPFLYRYHSFFSRAIPVKSDLPIIVNTCFFFFEK